MRKHMAAVGVFVSLAFGTLQLRAGTFGPGDHWVDTVTEGTYVMNVDGDFYTTVYGIGASSFVASGQIMVWYDDARDTPDPLDPGHSNHVDVEIVSMNLTGNAPGVGPVALRSGDSVANGMSDGPLFTGGTIIEATDDPSLADSFFDIFFEVEISAYALTIFNKQPLQVSGRIDRIPPVGFAYVSLGAVELYDAANPDGPAVARMDNAVYTPEPSTLALVGLGGLRLLARRRRRHR